MAASFLAEFIHSARAPMLPTDVMAGGGTPTAKLLAPCAPHMIVVAATRSDRPPHVPFLPVKGGAPLGIGKIVVPLAPEPGATNAASTPPFATPAKGSAADRVAETSTRSWCK